MASPKRIILISGGNAGIGFEIVKKLATEHADTHILMGTRTLSKGQAAHATLNSPANVTPLELDITSDASIASAMSYITSTFSRLDVLINNAGIGGTEAGPDASLRDRFALVYDTNVTSAAVLTDACAPLLDASPDPRVIFISSSLGSTGRFVTSDLILPIPWYTSSKAALNHLAVYYARRNPRWKSNACCPGLRDTGLTKMGERAKEENHPSLGAVNACRLVDDQGGKTATFSETEGELPW